jgi:hypothetical protein
MFVAPPEIDRNIRELRQVAKPELSETLRIQSTDVLRWAMNNTCLHVVHHLPQWAEQGVDYKRRSSVWSACNILDGQSIRALSSSWLAPEARTLQDLYQPLSSEEIPHPAFEYHDIRKRCEDLGVTKLLISGADEEQEREVSHELELEREIERPKKATPAQHSVHPDVKRFVDTGLLSSSSPAFAPLFAPLTNTNPRLCFCNPWSSRLQATKDYERTIAKQNDGKIGDYMRPLNWILSSSEQEVLVAMSPYEVNSLLPKIRRSRKVRLHQYAPRVTKGMKPLDDLCFNPIPPLPDPTSWKPDANDIAQMNLWAGQLYFTDYESSRRLRTLLGLATPETDDLNIIANFDGWISPEDRNDEMQKLCKFEDNPIQMLKEYISLQRKGMGYGETQLGRILRGKILDSDDLDFA